VRPLEFYRLGLALAQNSALESVQRTVVNRIYYGLHHEACCRYFRTHPQSRPLNINRRHTELRDRFNDSDDPEAKYVGGFLNDLMILRRESDYELVPPFRFRRRSLTVQELVQQAIESGEDLLDALERFSPGEAPDGCECRTAYPSG
jgi:hypothetical protein